MAATVLLSSPWDAQFDELVEGSSSSLLLCSPFISREPCERIAACLQAKATLQSFDLSIVTDLSRENLISGATDAAAILDLIAVVPNGVVRFLPSLHAKVYVADEQRAIITSSNLTSNGIFVNFEYGVVLNQPALVRQVRQDILGYAALGSPADREQLRVFADIAREIRQLAAELERSADRRLRAEFDRRMAVANEQILRSRAAGRTPHAIFADAILHILATGPLTTEEIHKRVQHIHPDLCDDTVDLVIDGRAFGRKWKHGVRTAQQHLKRSGRIVLRDGRWALLPGTRG